MWAMHAWVLGTTTLVTFITSFDSLFIVQQGNTTVPSVPTLKAILVRASLDGSAQCSGKQVQK